MIKTYSFRGRSYLLIFIIIWSLTITASLIWNNIHLRKMTLEMAIHEAKISLEKDIIYRDWFTRNQHVYVGVSEETT